MNSIKFTINKQGEVTVAPEGFGPDCLAATEKVEGRLGLKKREDLLPEYYQQQADQQLKLNL